MNQYSRVRPVVAIFAVVLSSLGLAACDKGNPPADPPSFVGKFANEKLIVEFVQSGNGYTGTFTIGNGTYPAKGSVTGQELSGTFSTSSHDYEFTGTLDGNRLTVASDGTTYVLDRVDQNPLTVNSNGGGASATGSGGAGAPGGGTAMGGGADAGTAEEFTVLGTTDHGQTLFLKLATGLSINDSLKQTAQALAKKLDGKPVITRAFTDAKNKTTGGATFTGTLKDQAVKGVILCGGDSSAGSANVVIASADASRADTKALMDFIPQPLKITTTQFPDGSGSIDLPEGWRTPTQQAANGIVAMGPTGQAVTFGIVQNISDPNCRTVRLSQQTYQTALQMYQRQLQNYNARVASRWPAGSPPMQPTPPGDPNETAMKQGSPLRYCKYCNGADDVLRIYYPLLADLGQRYNQPYTSIDKIIAVVPVGDNSDSSGMKMGLGYYAVTDHYTDHEVQLRVVNLILTQNTTPGESWALITSVMRAPDASFDQDLPVMNAIQSGIKLNQAVVGREFSSIGDMVRASGQSAFDAMEKNHAVWQDQQASEFRSFQERMRAQQVARQKSALDMIEFAGGLRTVYDTETGQWGHVDLLNSDGIVDALNWAADDPNRYVQVPLRDLRTDMW